VPLHKNKKTIHQFKTIAPIEIYKKKYENICFNMPYYNDYRVNIILWITLRTLYLYRIQICILYKCVCVFYFNKKKKYITHCNAVNGIVLEMSTKPNKCYVNLIPREMYNIRKKRCSHVLYSTDYSYLRERVFL